MSKYVENKKTGLYKFEFILMIFEASFIWKKQLYQLRAQSQIR